MRVDAWGTIDKRSSAFTGPLEVGVGDAFRVTQYFDLDVVPRILTPDEHASYRGNGLAMVATLGTYHVTSGTPVGPVPASMRVTYANAFVSNYDPPSYHGIGFNSSATAATTLGGFSPYYVSVSAQDHDSTVFSDINFSPEKFTSATLAEMEQARVDFSLHDGTTVLRFNGTLEGWSAAIVAGVPGPSPVPLPAAGWLLLTGMGGLAAMRGQRRG